MNARTPRLVLAGGGTGGHVIPAIAVAEEFVRLGGEARFVGTEDRLEARLVPRAGFGIDFIRVCPLMGGGAAGVARGVLSVPLALARSRRVLRRLDPSVVLGVGGYVAGPVVMAARLMGLPSALLEQNATVGLTNKLLSRFVHQAYVSYEALVDSFPAGRAQATGNPIPRRLVEAAAAVDPAGRKGPVRIVVMGGSQGARAIDQRAPAAMAAADLGGAVSVLHQCGPDGEEAVGEAYREAGIEAEVVRFIEDTATAYSRADLVVARAGATTVSELALFGVPAVFLPYPHHADRQQELNAAPMQRAGAAVVLDEASTGVPEMSSAIAELVRDGDRRRAASTAARELGRPEAASRVATALLALSRGGA